MNKFASKKGLHSRHHYPEVVNNAVICSHTKMAACRLRGKADLTVTTAPKDKMVCRAGGQFLEGTFYDERVKSGRPDFIPILAAQAMFPAGAAMEDSARDAPMVCFAPRTMEQIAHLAILNLDGEY